MVKGRSVGHGGDRREQPRGPSFDHTKTIIAMARRNGWDIEGLGLIPKNLAVIQETGLSRKQVTERNRLVKSIFKRFSRILTSPIPSDLEESIRSKAPSSWLPWEEEAIEKIGQWRNELEKIRPAILSELARAFLTEKRTSS